MVSLEGNLERVFEKELRGKSPIDLGYDDMAYLIALASSPEMPIVSFTTDFFLNFIKEASPALDKNLSGELKKFNPEVVQGYFNYIKQKKLFVEFGGGESGNVPLIYELNGEVSMPSVFTRIIMYNISIYTSRRFPDKFFNNFSKYCIDISEKEEKKLTKEHENQPKEKEQFSDEDIPF